MLLGHFETLSLTYRTLGDSGFRVLPVGILEWIRRVTDGRKVHIVGFSLTQAFLDIQFEGALNKTCLGYGKGAEYRVMAEVLRQ